MPRHRRLRIVLAGCAVLVALHPLLAAVNNPAKPKKSTTGAVFRSLVFPGWGQLYTHDYWKAAAFALSQGSFIASIWWNENKAKDFIRAHNFEYANFHRNQRNRLIWWLAGTTLLSMGDAYVDAHLYGLDWSPEISINEGGTGGEITLAVRF